MQLLMRLSPWDVRRLVLDEFRRRAEWILKWTEAQGERRSA
jgi:hypothetical protein